MRILVFSWRDPKHPLAGGAEQVMHEHMKGWVAHDHKVTLFTSRFERSLKEEYIDNIKIIRRGNQYHLGVQLAGFFYYLKNLNKYDFVVDQFHGMPFFTSLYVRKPKLAILQEVAREVWFLNPFPQPLRLIYGVLGYLLEPIVFVLYRQVHFMTGSVSAKKDIINLGVERNKVAVVPHGVIVERPYPFPKKEKIKTVVYLGVLSRDKGIVDALRCFHILSQKGKFLFWVIGRSETESYTREIQKTVLELGLENKIVFWGFVSQKKKFELLSRAHLLVNLSVREGWGLVNIEANAVGIPVVAYRSPGLIDSVKDGISGILCSENTPFCVVKEILNLLGNKTLYKKFSKTSEKWSKNFSWELSCVKSLKLINRIAQSKKQ